MLQVFHNAGFQLMGRTKYYFMAFSIVCMTLAIVFIAGGFNYGIDFAGGTAVQVRFAERPSLDHLRSALDAAGLGDVTLQQIGDPKDHEILIRVERDAKAEAGSGEGGGVSQRVIRALRELDGPPATDRIDLNAASESTLREWIASRLPAGEAGATPPDAAAAAAAIVRARTEHGGLFSDPAQVAAIPGIPEALRPVLRDGSTLGKFAVRGVDFVGPTAGAELMQNTLWAIVGAVTGILMYVWLRFHKIAWGVAAVIALVHDVVIAAGAVALTNKEFSLTVVAALLTILGYSINDTIVVFDRVRENLRLYRDHDFERVVNASVNQTLSRTMLTVFTVFVAVLALFLYGGEKLNPMSFCLLVGIVFGSYSSVFVAAGLLVIAYRWLGAKHVRV
ncbi:MAG TPA: protein translocase subunit SecF [Candidatus Polarisedimenticolia bacterium]|nr:protein translocase subunit SecF [Candidatus Polarisedimenticolia bacterium]